MPVLDHKSAASQQTNFQPQKMGENMNIENEVDFKCFGRLMKFLRYYQLLL